MNERDRFYACMNYQPVDQAPYWSWGAWPETIERWKIEGYKPEKDELDIGRYFWKLVFDKWFFPHPPFERKIVQEDAKHVLYINHEGILMREFKNNPMSSMPQFVRFPVETREDFRQFWKERMQPDLSRRISPDWKENLKALRSRPYPFIVIADRWGGFFGPLRNLVGVERLCTLFYDDPAFLEEMMETEADFIIALMSQVLDVVKVDAFAFWEDMAYHTAPLISPALARRYLLPRYRRVTDFLFSRGVPFVGLDSDGQVDPLIPVWLDSGMNFLYPFEVQAGMDVLAVRKKYGRNLRIWGGIDKRALTRGPAAIDAELARVRTLIEDGGYIPHLDHTAPPDVSYSMHIYYLRKLDEMCQLH